MFCSVLDGVLVLGVVRFFRSVWFVSLEVRQSVWYLGALDNPQAYPQQPFFGVCFVLGWV
jgi:hypothetical protein